MIDHCFFSGKGATRQSHFAIMYDDRYVENSSVVVQNIVMWNHPETRKCCRIIEVSRSSEKWKIIFNPTSKYKVKIGKHFFDQHQTCQLAPFLVLCRTCQKFPRPAVLRCRGPTSGQFKKGVVSGIECLPRIQRVSETAKCFQFIYIDPCPYIYCGINRRIPIVGAACKNLSSM